MRPIDTIIIHCSATRRGMDIGADEIRRWHINDNGWDDIGYHGVIRRDGTLDSGRPLNRPGAHTAGHNSRSVGICLAGGVAEDGRTPEANFSPAQWAALERLVRGLLAKFPGARVAGHNEFTRKACPSFSVPDWWKKVNSGEKRQPAPEDGQTGQPIPAAGLSRRSA